MLIQIVLPSSRTTAGLTMRTELELTTCGSELLRQYGRDPSKAMNSVPGTLTDEYTTISIDSVVEMKV